MLIQRAGEFGLVEGQDGLSRRAFTAADVSRMLQARIMHEDEPFELVEGELVYREPQGFAYDALKTALMRKLILFLPEALFLGAEVSVQLSTDSIVQPNLVVASRTAVGPSAEGFLTIPATRLLLLVEIAATSLSFDRGRKAALYAREGVPEYWVIDAKTLVTWVHRRPAPVGFGEVTSTAADQELRPILPELAGFAIRLADLV